LDTLNSDCELGKLLFLTIVSSNIILMISVVIVMVGTLFNVLKYLHFGSNITWVLVWIGALSCGSFLVGLIAMIHGMLCMLNTVFLIVYWCHGKYSSVVRFWRMIALLSLLLMLLCWLISVLGVIAHDSCLRDNYF